MRTLARTGVLLASQPESQEAQKRLHTECDVCAAESLVVEPLEIVKLGGREAHDLRMGPCTSCRKAQRCRKRCSNWHRLSTHKCKQGRIPWHDARRVTSDCLEEWGHRSRGLSNPLIHPYELKVLANCRESRHIRPDLRHIRNEFRYRRSTLHSRRNSRLKTGRSIKSNLEFVLLKIQTSNNNSMIMPTHIMEIYLGQANIFGCCRRHIVCFTALKLTDVILCDNQVLHSCCPRKNRRRCKHSRCNENI